MRLFLTYPLILCCLGFCFCICGCQSTTLTEAKLPSRNRLVRDRLVFFTNFKIPKRHRLLEDLVNNRRRITETLALPDSDEPIDVYLFKDEKRYRRYLRQFLPSLPDRRAFFVKNDTYLRVFAHWGDHVAEDLRHEVTHGYLHSVVPDLPLWLDEGLAEYYEVGIGRRGRNRPHILALVARFRRGKWRPDLKRLEKLTDAGALTQNDYAEAWLWTHFLLDSSEENRQIVRDQLARIRMAGDVKPMSEQLDKKFKNVEETLLRHLKKLAEEL